MMTIMITITIMMTMTMTMTITITIMLTITVTVTIMMTITITITITIMMTMTITISNGNRTEWSPIRSVIIRVINKIGRPRSGSPICLIIQTELDDTKFCYQLIITLTKFVT